MVVRGHSSKTKALYERFQKAISKGDANKAAELNGELITDALERGEIDESSARKMRMDLATAIIRTLPNETREKVTLSLPNDVLKGLRLASAETRTEMSEIVAQSLRQELKKYPHASQALRKTK